MDIPRPPAGEPQLPAPHFPPSGDAEADPDGSAAEGLIPEQRAGEPVETELPLPGVTGHADVSPIYVAAPERPAGAAAAEPVAATTAGPVEGAGEPEQLELALVLESEAVYLDPEVFPDRSMHIPYPRKATS